MELRHLRTFVTVAETLNISAAARRLRVTQPALSRQIHMLEHTVGHRLFVRQRDGLKLTATGVTLRDDGAKALAAVDLALQNARGAGAKTHATVRFGYYGTSIWEQLLASPVELFGRKFPQVKLAMHEESSVHLANCLREGALDLALLASGDYEQIPGAISEIACRVPAMVVLPANHRLAKRRAIALAELRDETIIGFNQKDAPGKYRAFLAACREAGFKPKVFYVASIFAEIMNAVKQSMGVAILSAFAETVPHSGVVFVKLKPPAVLFNLYVARAQHASAEATELAQMLIAQAQRATALLPTA